MLFAILLPFWPLKSLTWLSLVLLAWLQWRGELHAFLRLLLRSKFLFLGLALAYALSAVRDEAALLHAALYLAVLLAALQALLLALPREQLLAGIVAVLRPFAGLGIAVERCSVRLALTLKYAAELRGQHWRALRDEVMLGEAVPLYSERLTLQRYPLRVRDGVWLAAIALVLGAGALIFAR